jgi:S-adenosylmethionine decarboxylase
MENTTRGAMAAVSNTQRISHDGGRAIHAEQIDPRVLAGKEAVDTSDHFVEKDGMRFAGTHLIIDLWHASHLDNIEAVETALRDSVEASGATLLKLDLHCFSPSGGITGVAVLAESHISIHTWPERAYAAIDVFMCGDADPHRAIGVLRHAFAPRMLTVSEHRRGVMP